MPNPEYDRQVIQPRILTVASRQVLLPVFATCLGFPTVLLSQDQADAQQRAAEQARQMEARREAEEFRQMLERSNRLMREFLNDTPQTPQQVAARRSQNHRRSFAEFQTALSSFGPAISELTRSLDDKVAPKESAKVIDECTKSFLDYIRRINEQHPRFDESEFNDFTDTELGWEALTTAERIVPDLFALIASENATTVDIKFLASLPQLELDILRLQWMSRRLK